MGPGPPRSGVGAAKLPDLLERPITPCRGDCWLRCRHGSSLPCDLNLGKSRISSPMSTTPVAWRAVSEEMARAPSASWRAGHQRSGAGPGPQLADQCPPQRPHGQAVPRRKQAGRVLRSSCALVKQSAAACPPRGGAWIEPLRRRRGSIRSPPSDLGGGLKRGAHHGQTVRQWSGSCIRTLRALKALLARPGPDALPPPAAPASTRPLVRGTAMASRGDRPRRSSSGQVMLRIVGHHFGGAGRGTASASPRAGETGSTPKRWARPTTQVASSSTAATSAAGGPSNCSVQGARPGHTQTD